MELKDTYLLLSRTADHCQRAKKGTENRTLLW
jgi:hypothetical protein